MHFEGICGLKTELNYPYNPYHSSMIALILNIGYMYLLSKKFFKKMIVRESDTSLIVVFLYLSQWNLNRISLISLLYLSGTYLSGFSVRFQWCLLVSL